ncbi:hypothetical protein [Pseudoalteromonas denitrificans]|uniref:Uncharacterized protein n=1 Tax=Pseudoalteromonas denitrificans DSM 6059 TaxID=1123010 RepID=A0A1I1QQZ6_9GAMM|nr:hypothetical protein [Pseudoalteromonas denitrificans]SFD24437.1 hypothetical protein SAMN02745724_03975 [Pseudoalteromonas denitrificans DSM 6059]
MEQVLISSINLLGVILCLGVFFIKNEFTLKVSAFLGMGILFAVNSFENLPAGNLSNISLVLINTFYIFKLFTYHIEQ